MLLIILSLQAPEQFEGRPVNEKVDLYSFGVLLWECLSGKQPWAELDHPMQVMSTYIQQASHCIYGIAHTIY